MKKTVATILLVLIAVLSVPVALVIAGFATPPQFAETYYGELSHMYRRLKKTEGKKIVFIGNSGVAFGVRSDLVEREFPGYDVVNFGLYGAIGTKTMMDIAKPYIGKDDIIVILPEQIGQSMSLYFSAETVWKAADSDFSILSGIDAENMGSMVGSYIGYVSEKLKYVSSGKPKVDGVYAQSSFNDANGNEVGYMTYNRPYNMMLGGYDATLLPDFDRSALNDEFADYVNDYYDYTYNKGATLLYGFAPINNLSVVSDEIDIETELFYSHLKEKIFCRIIGHPKNYIMDYEWFYDNNAHVNSAGMIVYTAKLIEDIKTALVISTPTDIVLPEKPEIPVTEVPDGNNSDADCFTYQITEYGIELTGLTEKGAAKSFLILPTSYDGVAVVSFTQNVFAGNTTVSEITLPKTIAQIMDLSFSGCTRLTKIILQNTNPNTCNIGMALLSGADNCYIYVPKDAYDIFAGHYNWGAYNKRIKTY